ncbi:radial spoke head 10 homolog B-like isoform X2 [Chiroxiphia lanceolata]|uniref:radial spoke head 10 homolog B-like isoform X2 n=1 Tax=Chiroxiphia lanceolata TaxID=296741 RepID=UPI0013CEE39A|nr:radial spoke head 10 homolog B-like isoform X2 [Chiroxiphia lanceolata]
MPKGKKKDVTKKDVKKKDSKTADSEKAEESVHTPDPAQDTTAESGLTGLPDLQSDSVNAVGETQATREIPEEEKEPPVQPVPQYREEPILAQIIVKSYEGEQVNGLYEGEGFACFEGGSTYKGTFSEGFMHGQGTYTWADGVKYEGTFAKNVQMFNGRYTWNDGVYEGSIKDGIRHGFGFFRSRTRPISYLGEWCNGKRHGNGIIYFDEEHASWYSGEWVNNVREGWGMRRYKSGNTYEGHWKKNVRHGHGRMMWLAAKQEYIGQWVNGIQHGYGTHVWFFERAPLSQYPLRNEYVGHFVRGERHGHGKFIYAGGAQYEGQWVCNKKHGKGKFVFKNGHAYEGEFVDDRLVVLNLPVNAVNAKELSGIGTPSVIENITVINDSESTSILGSDIELDISSLLELFPREERQEELHQVEHAVLRHMITLRRDYNFYSALGYAHSPDNTFLMTKLQFWRFLKDCRFHHSKISLAEMDRVVGGGKELLEIHCPHQQLLFRTFLSYLIHLAFRIYHKKHKVKGRSLDGCFSAMMSRNVIPTACCVQGILFSEERHTVFAMSYIDKCWEIFRAFHSPNPNPPFEPTMKIRQFVWMLDELKLLNKQLTVSKLVKIFVKVGASPRGRTGINMELELVFLEFFEALLECAVVYVTHDMVKEQIAHETQNRASFRFKNFSRETSTLYSGYSQPLRSREDEEQCQQASLLETVLSFAPSCADSKDDLSLSSWDAGKEPDSSPAKELGDEAKEDKTEQDEKFCLWMYQVEIFFTTKLFPAYQQEKVLRQKVEEKQKEDVELAELRKIKDMELAKLIAEREAEEVRRQEAAAAEKAGASQSADAEEPEDPVPQEVSPRKGSRARLSKGEAQKGGPSPKKDAHRKDSSQKKEAQKKAPSVKKEAQKAAPAGSKGPSNKKNKPSGKNH